ncbi:retrovirus-related pol polyprotein from transposon TNT 1-94 [Tanacetum coccineum]
MDDLLILKRSQQEKKETAIQGFIPYWDVSMIDDERARENFMKDICTFLRKFSRIPFGVTPKVILIAWESFSKIKDALMDKQYQQEDIQELMNKLLEDVRNIREEFSEYINCPSWNRPLFYFDNDDDDVEDLVPIPSGSKGVSDDICDNDHSDAESLLSQDIPITSPKIDFLSEEFAGELAPIPLGMDEDEFDEKEDDCYDDDTSSDDDSYENIEYVEASPLNLEYNSLEEENKDQEEKEFDLEDIFQIQDVILREKLLNISRLITNIESLKDNPIPNRVLKSPSLVPIFVTDSGSFFEESDTFLSHLDNSLPEFETFSDHTEETRSGRTTTHNSLPEYDSFLFEFESFHFDLYDDPSFPRPPPEPPDVEISLIVETDAPVINNVDELNEDDDSFTFVIQTFLRFLTYPEVRILQKSQENGQNRTITNTGTELSVQKEENAIKAVKLNKGLKETNHEQLYVYLKQHEKHVAQDRLIIERITLPTNDLLAFVSSVQPYSQPSQSQSLQYQSSTTPSQSQNGGQIVVQTVQGRQNQNQRNFSWGNGVAGFGGTHNRAGNANAGQGKPIKCYNCNGIGHIARNCTQPKCPQNSDYFKDKMLLMQAQENGAVLDEEELLFLVGEQPNTFDVDVDNQPVKDLARNEDNIFQADECDAFDSDVDDEPTAQSIFMANLSSVGPTNL